MTKNNKIKAITLDESRKVKKDNRTHDEKLIALREAFGRRKEMARNSGKINDCSINKIAEEAKIDKLWLLGHREVKNDPNIKSSYQKLRDEILLYRKNFSPDKDLSEDKILIKELQEKLDGLHASIEPTFQRMAFLEKKVQSFTKAASNLDAQTTQLIAKNLELEEKLDSPATNNHIFNSLPVKRVIICPDEHRKISGKYVLEDKKLEASAWKKSIEELNKYLRRKLPMRLYVLVGLPCSGKTTWSKSPNTYFDSDRHPVIFDSTNLTSIERIKLIQPILHYTDLPIVCVYFDTDIDTIRQCNKKSDGWERAIFTDSQLTKYFKQLEKPDPYEEKWIDDLRIVRRI